VELHSAHAQRGTQRVTSRVTWRGSRFSRLNRQGRLTNAACRIQSRLSRSSAQEHLSRSLVSCHTTSQLQFNCNGPTRRAPTSPQSDFYWCIRSLLPRPLNSWDILGQQRDTEREARRSPSRAAEPPPQRASGSLKVGGRDRGPENLAVTVYSTTRQRLPMAQM
jgi:hypothetical protein